MSSVTLGPAVPGRRRAGRGKAPSCPKPIVSKLCNAAVRQCQNLYVILVAFLGTLFQRTFSTICQNAQLGDCDFIGHIAPHFLSWPAWWNVSAVCPRQSPQSTVHISSTNNRLETWSAGDMLQGGRVSSHAEQCKGCKQSKPPTFSGRSLLTSLFWASVWDWLLNQPVGL